MRRLEETLLLLARQDPSVDTEELSDRIERQMSEERVPVVARNKSSIMHTEVRPPRAVPVRGSRKVWLLAAAVLAVIATIGTPLWLLGGENPDGAVSEPEPVFSWGDDIFEWVTADEMEVVFESLSIRHAGVALSEGEVVLERSGGPSADPWDEWNWIHEPIAPSQTPWRPPPGRWIAGARMWEWEEFVIAPQTDRRLPDGVVFWPGPWGSGYTLRGPNSSEAIGISLLPPLESDLHPFDTYPDRRETYDEMLFEVASMMLRELGWAD
jgi:hypothetical protein